MEYQKLLNLGSELGRRLLLSGAEIYRAEESVTRLLMAYGLEPQVFAIPNCLIVSINTPEGEPLTKMYRIPGHGTDIELLEHCNQLCRRLCSDPIPVDEALALVRALPAQSRQHGPAVILLGHMLAGGFFAAFFGGCVSDVLCACITALAVGLCVLYGQPFIGSNPFFRTVICSAVAAALPMILTGIGWGQNVDYITIGVLMLLVPGMSLTNAMREIMAGDIISGVNRTAEVILIATAIALGSAFPMLLANVL